MALPTEAQRSFRLYVTHVDGEGHFLKISGQLDQQSSLMVESLFESARENLEQGIGAVPPAAIHEGVICAAKYKDGTYYRAKIINITNLANGLVGVHFIDYGNKDIISLSTIRFLDSYDPMFLQLRGQATDYYLSRVMHPSGRWEEPILLKLQSLLCYAEYPASVETQTRTLPIISIQFKGNDLSTHLVSNRFGIALPVPKQEVLLLQMADNQLGTSWSPTLLTDAPPFTEHVPFLINQNFPNPASAMRFNQNMPIPFNGAPVPPGVGQRLLINKASRNMVNLRAPVRQPQHAPASVPSAAPMTPPSAMTNKPPSPKKSITYKSRLLEVNSQHKVFVSFAEEGPELFAVQLVSDATKLQDMMDDINRRPHSSLAEPPMIGTVCLGRMSGDRIICRAIVMNLSGSQCKLFFVDFGDTEMVSYYDIFDIPEEFVKPNVFAMRFCLSGVKKLEKSPHLNEAFKQLVSGKVLTLRVVSPEGPPLIQYGELFLDNKSVLDLLMANMKDKLQFKWMEMLPLGSRQSVLVSYVDSCIKFYVQLSDKIDDLKAVMSAVKTHCENTSSPGELPVGAVCCARFPDDDNWYRAMVMGSRGNKVVVAYVDYGNEQEVEVTDLRTITPDLIRLPAQAMKCALKGFENKPIETKTSNQLEMLALEKTLMAHIVGVLSSDTMLVTLIDDTVTPPLDVAKKMNQLSQPRSNTIEGKATTPFRKDAPETISSPEGSIQDDKKKNFRREKSFKDEKRKDGEDFGPRGGSFRGRDQKEGFERSGPGRHSEKYGTKTDRGDRRGPPRPRDNNSTTTNDNEREEISPPQRPNRENPRERRKPRMDQDKRGAWKKEGSGVGKRLRQAAEAASLDAQAHAQRGSIQDRLKRDNRYTQDEDSRADDRGNRGFRPDRRDNRGDRRENWGDKKENWNQKREFRDNRADRGERQDKGRSNFTPRDRAERTDRSFGSDTDKRSERSFRSQDSGNNRNSRTPPHKPRGKFTQVQCKELSDPLPLETPFTEPTVEIGSQQEVSVTWIISPENFYTQILSLQPKFLEMMHKIPELYKGVRSYSGNVQIGSSVLARYPADGVLYRATIVSVQPFSKFIVRYVDFGNKQLVDSKDIWQMERELMELPKMAVHCSLSGVVPKTGEWKADPEIDLCFNAPRYQCVFQECVEDQYKVSLWNNGVSVADLLVEKQLAVMSESQTAVTLKDEAIDLTIIVGQQIMCRVTHVESFEKFFVQLDLDKAELVENAITSYDVAMLTPLAADSLMEGIHCTVKHDDKVYRAILNDVSDTNNIEAVLPDYGNTITTTLDKLMILPTELSVYYYQSLQCSLNNYTKESKTLLSLDDLKKRLTGNKFIIYVNYVEGITLVSTLYEGVTGQKVAIFEPDEGAYDEVVPLCTRAVFNYNFGNAYISHIENLNEFYLQKSSDGDKIAQLLEHLYKFYEEGTPEALNEFEADGLCVAKSSDGNWYRATILSSTETHVKVQFPDYGNSEIVPKEAVKKLDPKFYEPCCLALVASLGLVSLQEETISKLMEWTTEKELQVTLAFGNDGWLANLHLDGVDLSMKLINEKLAATRIIAEVIPEEPKSDAPIEEPISLPEGCTQVYISHIDTPGHFWLQMLDKVQNIDEIQGELQSNAESYADIENREMGTLCVAKYLADDQWYRAEILDSDSDITTIRFIDYGNTDVLDNQPGLLKVMPDHLKEIERYAIKSSVNAIPTGTGQWSEPASDYFTQLVGDLSLPVDALIVLKDVTTYVDIFVNGQNVTDKLVSEGHATRSEETECGDLPSCFASHVNSPSEFWIQLETAAPELQSMEAAMVDAENFPELTEKEEGVLCAAKYPEDGAWYRAQVIVDGSEGTEVLFMDYGNASIANELRSLPDELKLKPALSRKCALQKPRDIKSWSRKSEIKFNELAAEGATIFNVQFIASGDISIVELYLDGKSVTEELVGLCEEHPASERPTPVGQDLHSSGKICYVNSLEEFYVHLDDSIPSLDKITDKLSECSEFEPISELKVGSICAAFWSEDEQWYRSRILEFCDVGYHVQFIDYGNKAKCEDFRQLPDDIAMIEPLAKCCRLAGFTDDISNESAKSKLEDLVTELVTFQIEFLDSIKEPSLVRLLLNGTDLSSVLKTDTPDLVDETEPIAEKEKTTNDCDNENPSEGLNSSQQDSIESISSYNTVIMALDVEKDNLNKSNTSLEGEKDISNKSNTSLEGEKDDSNKSNTSLEGEKDNSNKSITTFDGEKDISNKSITSLEGKNDISNKSNTSLEGEKDDSNKSNTSLEGEKDNSNKSITSFEGEKDISNKSITSSEGEKDISNKSITSVEGEKDISNKSNTSLEGEKDNSNKSITSSEGEKDISNKSITSVEGEKDISNKSNTSLEGEKDNLNISTASTEEGKDNSNKSTTSNESNQDKVITPEKTVDNLERSNEQSIASVKEEPKEQLNNDKDDSSEDHVESVAETVSLDKKLVSQDDEKPVEVA